MTTENIPNAENAMKAIAMREPMILKIKAGSPRPFSLHMKMRTVRPTPPKKEATTPKRILAESESGFEWDECIENLVRLTVGAQLPQPTAAIAALATAGARSTPDTTVQINHISSHFSPLKIDTTLVPPVDGLDAAGRLERRLDEPVGTNLYFHYPALELWNGASRGSQGEFLVGRIGIWFNLLNQDLPTTFIADTDSHRFTRLNSSGARTWTAAGPTSDQAGTVDSGEVARMVDAGKATGGQGVFVTTVLRATDGSGASAALTHSGSTHVSDSGGNVELDIRIQGPLWAEFDVVEIYANAATNVIDPANPYAYGATPTMVLDEGDCDPATTGDGDYDIAIVNAAAVAGADRLEANITVPFSGLTANTWFVVVVKGTDGQCSPMFPVFASDLSSASNATLADLLDGNVGESGVMSLGATNALYYDASP